MKLHIALLSSFLIAFTIAFSQNEATTSSGKKIVLYEDGTWLYADSLPLSKISATSITQLEIPKANASENITTHTGYAFSYNEKHEQANWVAYELTKEETNQLWERTDKFLIDPIVKTGTANDKDYAGSGYDRGHLAPAADMGWSSKSMSESFYYSNISPQDPSFNRGVWKRIEELVRTWASVNESIYVVTGPVLTTGLSTIGKNQVSIPQYFYKVILDYKEPGIKGIGFIIQNAGSSEQLQEFAVSIDMVEKLTGIDFFPLLPDDQENLIESTLSLKSWTWKSTKTTTIKDKETISSVQCNGNTKAGARCKNKTLNLSGYCYLHEGQNKGEVSSPPPTPKESKKSASSSGSTQCTGTTQKGARCKRMTTSSSGRCYQH